MRHATANRPSGARRPLAAAIAVAVITAAPVAAVGVNDAISALQQNGQYVADASHDDVMSAYTSIDKPGRLFLTNSGSSTSKRVPKGVVTLPWKISASFTLNGPDVSVSDVSGASGMIGIRIALHATKPDVTANLTPIVAFTIPGRVGSDVTADDGVLVSSDNTSTLVAAVGKPGEDLTFNAYVTAKHFTMSSLSIAAVEGNVQQSLPDLTKRATTLVDGLTNVGSQRNRKLIAQLEQLRDNEKALAKQTIAVRSKAHDQAFDGYIDAYVGSYTTHLSGSIGNATQLPAILGTASELNGDTSVAKSVADLANAVNDVSAAYRHIGAADAVDEVIRTIEQRGTSGLVNELTKRAGEEQQRGSKDYSAGQSQLSAAMIPYSMDFTDAYTARLKELGATAGTAGSYKTQAIADVRAGIKDNEKLKTASDKVSAAMTALADASEHTGQASAFHQIVLRFADQLDSDDDTSESGAADDASVLDTLRSASASQSLCAKAEKRRSRAQRKAERAQAKNNTADSTSLVDDKNAISMDDVMSYAGGLRPSFGAAADTTSKNVAKVGGVDGSSKNSGSDSSSSADSMSSSLPVAGYGLTKTGFTPDNGDLIDETVELAAAAEVFDDALQAGLGGNGSGNSSAGPQYLLSVPVL
ncbi:protein [Bifidobacterium adolescentis]|nr:protein [Bifidobacterium adolescentis]